MNQKCPNCHKLLPEGSRYCNACGYDMSFTMSPDGILPPGTTIRGTYVVEHMIGEGGMGVVYACKHKTLEKQYALKVLEPKYARMTSLRSRFLSEGKIQAKLAHPHIVKVIDVIDNEKDGGISSFLAIVMEYVQGNSLDHIIERGPLSEYDAVSTTLVVLDALGYAHHNGIVHRDMKPSNVMISDELAKDALYNGVKVMDFGIAKLLDSEAQSYTQTNSTIGTPLYMPPEQIETPKLIDERADLYAIGIMLYELLCGRTPFAEFKEFDLFRAQLNMKPPSIKNFRRDIPDKLEAIIMKSLEKNRDDRYPNAESFQRALLSLGGYDDIHLFLNPNDGLVVSSNNSLLQKKIQNALNRKSKEECEKSPQKAQQDKQFADDLVKQMVEQASENQQQNKEPSPKAEVSAAPKAPEQSPATSNNDSGLGSQRKKSRAQRSDAPRPQAKRPKDEMAYAMTADPSEEMPISPKQLRGKAPEIANEQPVEDSTKLAERDTPQRQKSTKTKSEKPREKAKSVATSQDAQPKRRKTEVQDADRRSATRPKKSSKNAHNEEPKAHIAPIPSSTATVNSLAVKSEHHLLKYAAVLAILILLILCAASLVYRQDTNMAPAITPAEPTQQPLAIDEPAVIDDVSALPLVEIETDTGLMTRIPTALHKLSGNEQLVEIPQFDIDQTEVSHYQYRKCVDSGKCAPLGFEPDSLNIPVTNIGFAAAQAYCKFAGKSLPTKEQWEAAARYGNHTDDVPNITCALVQYGANNACKKQNAPHPTSVFSHTGNANAGHIKNMFGNVREWVDEDSNDHKKKLTKGGSYVSKANELSYGEGSYQPVNQGAPDIGFRCVK